MGLTRPPAGIQAKPPGEPRWCTLCGTERLNTAADWEIAFASGETGMVSCNGHLSESMTMVMNSQTADHITVYDLTRGL